MKNTKKLTENAKKIINNAKKVMRNETLYGSWIEDNGKQYVSDSHRILEINDPVGLPVIDAPKCLRCYERFENAKREDVYTLEIPSLKSIKEQVDTLRKEDKRGKPVVVSLGEGQPTVNAEYLFQISEALGGVDVVYVNKKKPTIYPLYMESAIGAALLCPCANPDNRQGYWMP